MRKLLILLFLVVSSCSSSCMPNPPISHRTINEKQFLLRLKRRTVSIDANCGKGIRQIGSGVTMTTEVDRSKIVTAYHVVDSACKYYVTPYLKKRVPAKIIKIDKKNDLALLNIKNSVYLPTRVDLRPYLGQPIICVGWPTIFANRKVDYLSVTRGHISTLGVERDGTTYMRASADIYYGSSGGPCFNRDERLVGISTAFWGGTNLITGVDFPYPGQFYLAPGKYVQKLLDRPLLNGYPGQHE